MGKMRGAQAALVLMVLSVCANAQPEQAARRLTPIKLRTGILTVEAGISGRLKKLLQQTPKGRRVHAVFQWDRPLDIERHRSLLTLGAKITSWLRGHSYILSIPSDLDLDRLASETDLAGSSVLPPRLKVMPDLARSRAIAGEERDREFSLEVFFHRDVPDSLVSRALLKLGPDKFQVKNPRPQNAREIRFQGVEKADVLALLQQEDSVLLVAPPPPPPRNLGSLGRSVTKTDHVQGAMLLLSNPPGIIFNGPTGRGIRIGLFDIAGIWQEHDDFRELVGGKLKLSPRFYRVRSGLPSPDPNLWHGTLAASIMAGSGISSPAFNYRGHAPEALIGNFEADPLNLDLQHEALAGLFTQVQVHIYGEGVKGPEYSTQSAQIDRLIRGAHHHLLGPIPSVPHVWSFGNGGVPSDLAGSTPFLGYYSGDNVPKNAIVVGSVDTLTERVSAFSSLGPTMDGRIKPDIVAPGTHYWVPNTGTGINGAGVKSVSALNSGFGTSFATPAVAGILALMMQASSQSGGAPASLYPATWKAMLIQTARDLVSLNPPSNTPENPDTKTPLRYHAGPDLASGFGLVDAQAAVACARAPERRREGVLDPSTLEHTFDLWVPAGSGPLKLALAWDDLPLDPVVGGEESVLVNDLDMELVGPTGQVFQPWILAAPLQNPFPTNGNGDIDPGAITAAQKGEDHVNNVEVITVLSPDSGVWTVKIRISQNPEMTEQSYGLVSSHPFNIVALKLSPAEEICLKYSWLCAPQLPIPLTIGFGETRWEWKPLSVLPLELPRAGSVPPEQAWSPQRPPDGLVVVRGVPPGHQLIVFDASGTIAATALARRGLTAIHRSELGSGSRQLYLAIATSQGRPINETLSVSVTYSERAARSSDTQEENRD